MSEVKRSVFSPFANPDMASGYGAWYQTTGRPGLAADLAHRDAALSHRGDDVHGADFVTALGAAIPAANSLGEALEVASAEIPAALGAAEAVSFGCSLVGNLDAVDRLHEGYRDLSPLHTLNNLALVVWVLLSGAGDYSAAVGDVAAAGWDTDCNGATVGGLWGPQGWPILSRWTAPWQGRAAVTIAGAGN